LTGWRLWVDATPRPGWQNMAIDQALLDLAVGQGLAFLRLYRWEPFCLSFGRHEPARRRYGRERVEALGVDTVRRPTGGRAVWHARELTYAVAAPDGFGSLPVAYRRIHEMLAHAVRGLGADARLAAPPPRTPRPQDGACFASPVGGEVVVRGHKVVGSAQLRAPGAFLQHGSMLLQDDQRLVHDLAGTPAGERPEAALSDLLGRAVSFDEAVDAITHAACAWSDTWNQPEPEAILELADGHGERFRSGTWTWER
jgi:lipoyl(octanoyl) transferase